jgi:hypothetical protein
MNVTRILTGTTLALALAACGGGRDGVGRGPIALVTAGPIAKACLGSGRKAVTPARCDCIQQVADQTLSGADQRRGATFFGAPEKAQDVRLSDTQRDDDFWKRWTDYGKQAEQVCRG